MKKRARKRLNDKVILFPDLEKRLLEKGLESLQQKKFREAVEYLEEANALAPENHDILFGLVLAYFELGLLTKAKELANQMLQMGIGDYIHIVELYITILVQLHQYDEIVTTIEVLLEDREIPKEKFEHFTRMLHFSRKMEQSKPPIDIESTQDEMIREELNLFFYKDQEEQMKLASQLSERNIRPFIEEIKSYLSSKNGDVFLKTLLLKILIEQQYDKEVIVEKLDRALTVNPASMQHEIIQPQQSKLMQILVEQLEHEDPVLLENLKNLIGRHFFFIFPFQLQPFKDVVWAAAYHSLAAEYQGISCQLEELTCRYKVKEEDMMRAGLVLMKIEEISSPNL